MKKTIAIHKNKDGKCDFIIDVVCVDETEYMILKQECETNVEVFKEKIHEQKEVVENIKQDVATNTQEIKVLKGEE